ncbi:MAG: nickel insertion protein, partial [Desulfatirhabdiaceae bacterium]
IQMKKNRPAVQVSIICSPDATLKIADLLLKETTSIGLRWRYENRLKSVREMDKVETVYGTIRVKVARAGGGIINVSPEYEDCRKAAIQGGVPLKTVMDSVRCKLCLTSLPHPVES